MLLTIALQSHLEIWLGILAANLPVMSPLFTRWVAPGVSSIVRSWVSPLVSRKSSKNRESVEDASSEPLAMSVQVRREFSQLSDTRSSEDISLQRTNKIAIWRESEVQSEVRGASQLVSQEHGSGQV
jgi:hypothetical protein